MDMKVEHPRASQTMASDQVRHDSARGSASTAGAPAADRISLSASLRLVSAALQEARLDNPQIRPEAVARGRALLASGEIGTDLEALAQSIIDSLVYSHDDDPS
jgi:hypothetical protein